MTIFLVVVGLQLLITVNTWFMCGRSLNLRMYDAHTFLQRQRHFGFARFTSGGVLFCRGGGVRWSVTDGR